MHTQETTQGDPDETFPITFPFESGPVASVFQVNWKECQFAASSAAEFGLKYCVPMYLEEFHLLPELIPTLQQTGFYSAGFGGLMCR